MEGKTTTIEISITTREKIHSLQDVLKKILHKRIVTPEQVILVILAVTRLDDTLIEMQLE